MHREVFSTIAFIAMLSTFYPSDGKCQFSEEYQGVLQDLAERLGLDARPSEDCKLTQGFDWTQPAVSDLPLETSITSPVSISMRQTSKVFDKLRITSTVYDSCASMWDNFIFQTEISIQSYVNWCLHK